jgi:hypothetical protein
MGVVRLISVFLFSEREIEREKACGLEQAKPPHDIHPALSGSRIERAQRQVNVMKGKGIRALLEDAELKEKCLFKLPRARA